VAVVDFPEALDLDFGFADLPLPLPRPRPESVVGGATLLASKSSSSEFGLNVRKIEIESQQNDKCEKQNKKK
jgi:hypothetical protein